MKFLITLLISMISIQAHTNECAHKTVICNSKIATQNSYVLSYRKCISSKTLPEDKYGSFKVIATNSQGNKTVLHNMKIETTELHYFNAEILNEEIVKLKIVDTGIKSKNTPDLSTTNYDFIELQHYSCEEHNEFNPQNCKSGSWYDGCNYCMKSQSSIAGILCTKRMCSKDLLDTPYCIN